MTSTRLALCCLLLSAYLCSAELPYHHSRRGAASRTIQTALSYQDDGMSRAAYAANNLQDTAAASTAIARLQQQSQQQQPALPACQLSPADRTNATFDYYTFSALWPPSIFQFGQSYTAGQMVQQGVAVNGFWVHGLWPSTSQGSSVMNCGTKQLQLADIPNNILPNMTYWWPGVKIPFTQASALELWSHEWQKHGTCSGQNTSAYFTLAAHEAELYLPRLTELFKAANLTPNSQTPYTLGQVQRVLDEAYANSYIITCDNNTAGQLMLSQVEICLSQWTMDRCNCLLLANGQRLEKKSSCGSNSDGQIWIMAYATEATYGGVQLGEATATIIGCVGGLLVLLALSWLVAWQCGFITPLLKLKKVTVVHNPLIHEPVVVLCEPLSMEWLWSSSPGLADFVHDLPAGMAIKGGIARKVLKYMYGRPEPPSSFDIDCLVLLPDEAFQICHGLDRPDSGQAAQLHSGSDRPGSRQVGGPDTAGAESATRAAHDAVTGMQLGALRLEAQDVEVIPKSHLRDYFVSRDVTMNEVLILNNGQQPMLFYTAAAKADVEANLVRPSCHMKTSEMQVYWDVDEATGAPYIAASVVCRCIIRYLKGHGSDYAFDAGTWAHYRHRKLDKTALFKILRAFHTDSAKLQTAVDHLVDIGFLRRRDVWRAGGANKLWGLLLQEVNSNIAKHGGRLQLGQLDPEGVEKWITTKKAQTASKQLFGALQARRTGWLASAESAPELGLLHLPQELEAYIAAGPVFECNTYIQSKEQKVLDNLVGCGAQAGTPCQGAATHQHQQTGCADGTLTEAGPDSQAGLPPDLALSRRQVWSSFVRAASLAGPHDQAIQSVLQRYGSAVLQRNQVSGSAGGTVPATDQHHQDYCGHASANCPTMDAADAVMLNNLAQRRSRSAANKSLQAAERMQQQQHQQQQKEVLLQSTAATAPGTANHDVAVCGVASATPLAAASGTSTGADVSCETLWQRFSKMGTFHDVESKNQLGSFYQVLDTAGHSMLSADHHATTIITDSDRQCRRSRPTKQLLAFLFSTLKADAWLCLLACVLIFAGLACQLMLPWIEGQIIDVLSPWQVQQFYQMMGYMGALTAAALVLQLCGTLVLELAVRRIMDRLFQRLFNHLLAQNPDFFNSISKGELMSRLSGDSLALRGMISSSLLNMAQGVLIIVVIIGVLNWIWNETPYYGVNYFEMVLYTSLGVSLLEAIAAALAARPLNLKARQATGRMFGFLLDILSNTGAVCALGLQGMVAHSYSAYVADVFRCTFRLNVFMDVHKSFSLSVQAMVLLLFIYFGGQEVIAGLTSVGTLVATLRYIRMQQRGVKQLADAFVRFTAALGNLERLLDLHDKGTLSTLPDHCSSSGRQQGQQKFLAATKTLLSAPVQQSTAKLASAGGTGTAPTRSPTSAAANSAVSRRTHGCFNSSGSTAVSNSVSLLSDMPPAVKLAAAATRRRISVELVQEIELFAGMTGGLWLRGASVMVPGRAGRGAILRQLNLQLLPGTAALVIGSACEPLAPLMETAALLNVPFEGEVLLQLADPQQTAQQQHQQHSSAQACDHTAINIAQQAVKHSLQDYCRETASEQQPCSQHLQQQNVISIQPFEHNHQQQEPSVVTDSHWHAVQHLRDYLPAARRNIALVTVETGAVFRGSVEDNVACAAAAAAGDVTTAAIAAAAAAGLAHSRVVDVCGRVGLAEEVMLLPDGFRTVIGEGTGFTLSGKATLQVALARALLKQPKLLLLGNVTQLQAAVGRRVLLQVLRQQMAAGGAVLMTAVVSDEEQGIGAGGTAHVQDLVQGLDHLVRTYCMTDSSLVAMA